MLWFLYKLTMDFITFSRYTEKLYFGMSPNRVERHLCGKVEIFQSVVNQREFFFILDPVQNLLSGKVFIDKSRSSTWRIICSKRIFRFEIYYSSWIMQSRLTIDLKWKPSLEGQQLTSSLLLNVCVYTRCNQVQPERSITCTLPLLL